MSNEHNPFLVLHNGWLFTSAVKSELIIKVTFHFVQNRSHDIAKRMPTALPYAFHNI